MIPLEQKLQQLNLKAMSRQIEATIADAAARNLSVLATLELLADMELESRNGRAIERRRLRSRRQADRGLGGLFGPGAGFDDVDEVGSQRAQARLE